MTDMTDMKDLAETSATIRTDLKSETPLDPLTGSPVYFYVRWADRWRAMLDSTDTPKSLHDEHWRVIEHEDMFIVQTYVQLRRRGLDVRLSDRFVPGAINIASGLDFGIRERTFDSFVVAVRGDGFRPALADVVMAHNTSVMTRDDLWIPAWIQTGLIPRSDERCDTIENLEFKGDIINLHESFRSDEFGEKLAAMGLSFRIGGLDYTEQNRWNDYRVTDVVLAARDLPVADAMVKPGLKLVNAWAAGAPALLGPETGYQQLRRSELDYFEVRNDEQVLNALALLQDQPRLYRAMRENGLKRAEMFSDDNTAIRWRTLIEGPIAERFARWETEDKPHRLARFARRSARHKSEMKEAAKRRVALDRLLTGSPGQPTVDFDDPRADQGCRHPQAVSPA